MNISRFTIFMLGLTIIGLGYLVTDCLTSHHEEPLPVFKDRNIIRVSNETVTEMCFEISPTIIKCIRSDGTSRTILKI